MANIQPMHQQHKDALKQQGQKQPNPNNQVSEGNERPASDQHQQILKKTPKDPQGGNDGDCPNH